MFRSLVRARPSWPGVSTRPAMQPPRVSVAQQQAPRQAQQPAAVRSQPFHSTAPASIGFKNFKNSPRLKWKTQQKLDAKNADILAEAGGQPRVTYAEALKSHKPRAWIGARKKVVWGRLFGPSNTGGGNKQGQ
ncbi:unnamed protein product [Ectocarpus sp. 6 AP-2014]